MALDNLILQTAAQKYAVNDNHLTPLKGGNTNYVYQYLRAGKEYVLRIIPPDNEIDLIAANANMAFQNYLTQHMAEVSIPKPSIDNNLVEVVDYSGEPYIISACQKATGVLSETLPIAEWNAALFQSLGKTVGKMHALAQSYSPPSAILKHKSWENSPNIFNLDCPDDPQLEKVYERRNAILAHLADFSKDSENYGLIHCDLHFANFFIDTQTNTITIFDFDDCAYGWYLMDIATLFLDLCVVYSNSDKEVFAASFLENFLKGYLPEKRLSTRWMQQLPVFVKLLEISLYIDVYKYWKPDENESWVGKFMPGRKMSIEENLPFINIDFSQWMSG